MAVFSVLTAFGLNVVVRPILQIDDRDDYTSNTYENYNSETEEYEYDYDPDERFVGQLRPTLVTEEGAYHEHQKAEVLKAFGGTWAKVEWLTEPLGEAGLGLAHLTVCLFCVVVFIEWTYMVADLVLSMVMRLGLRLCIRMLRCLCLSLRLRNGLRRWVCRGSWFSWGDLKDFCTRKLLSSIVHR